MRYHSGFKKQQQSAPQESTWVWNRYNMEIIRKEGLASERIAQDGAN